MYTITIAQWYVGLHARQNQINIAYGRQINYITLHYIIKKNMQKTKIPKE